VTIPPTSIETPFAGEIIRLFPGTHSFAVAGTEENEVETTRAMISAYTTYLLVPASEQQCFFVQRTTYGRARPSGPRLRALPPEQKIWVMPERVDAWFAPNPAPFSEDTYSSGAERIAVRQIRCGSEP
jgi:hypothetical protein